MQVIIKNSKITKETFDAIKEAKVSKKSKGITSKGFRFIKTLNLLVLL
jgi:hypothetical protein